MSDKQTSIPVSSTAAERWLTDHGDSLYAYAMRRLRNADIAEDLVQETLLAALSSKDSYSGHSGERTWLIGILKHKLVDHLRKSIRQNPLVELKSDDPFDPFDKNGHWKIRVSRWQCDPKMAIENAEFRQALDSCLSKLPPRMSQVFWLHEAECMTLKELCGELEISPANIWTMLHRARLRLQACLTASWFEKGSK